MATKAEKAAAAKAAKEAAEVDVQETTVTPKVVSRKISKDELIPLQKEGKLKGYDPATGIGLVASVGKKIIWPKDDEE